MENWNQRFAHALAESDFNKNRLALEMKVSGPTVSAWAASGTIKPAETIDGRNLLKVCKLLKIRPEWLLLREGPMRPSPRRDLSPEMLAVIEVLEELDRQGGAEREDALYFMNRLLNAASRGEQKVGS